MTAIGEKAKMWKEINAKDFKERVKKTVKAIDYYEKKYTFKRGRLLDAITVAVRMAEYYQKHPLCGAINYDCHIGTGIGQSGIIHNDGSIECRFTIPISYNNEWWTLSAGTVEYNTRTDKIKIHLDKKHRMFEFVDYNKPIDNTELGKYLEE
jgi:hypothetical protein